MLVETAASRPTRAGVVIASLAAFALAGGCGGSGGSPDASDGGAAEAGDAARDVTAGDASDGGDGGDGSAEPVEIPSRQTVHFQFAGTGSGLLVTQTRACASMRVESTDGINTMQQWLPGGLQCGCMCMTTTDAGPTQLRPLDHGPFEITWDARAQVRYQRTIVCGPQDTQVENRGALQPLPAGVYRVTFAAENSAPAGCMTGADGVVSCNVPTVPRATYDGPVDLCPSTRMITVQVTLPASGDVTVMVPGT